MGWPVWKSRDGGTTSAIAPVTSSRWCTTRSSAPTSPTTCARAWRACWRRTRPRSELTLEEAGGNFLEVAVALPVQGTFTYRDPRPGVAAPIGAQVVVPFGARTVTGFVVARATAAGEGASAARDIEEIVAGEPAFD